MRISDWSSDVCSSDLQFALFTLQELTMGPLGLEAAARYEKTNVRAQTLGFERNFDSFSGAVGATYDVFEGGKFGLSVSRAVREIGRASCRARGWRYV